MKKSNTKYRLRQVMSERGITQSDILKAAQPYCEKYNVKLNKSNMSQYVSGKNEPGQDKIAVLSMALDVSEGWLMGYDVPSARTSPQVRKKPKGVRIPVYGYVAAGVPIEAITDYDSDDPDDWEEIPEEMAAGGDYIALRIKGDSMEPKFSPGDVVIVRLQEDADSGDIVIAMVNGDEATCKKLQKSADGIMLVALNPAYAPMYFSRKECIDIPVRILGRVVELRAKF